MNRFDEAIYYLDKAIQIDPNEIEFRINKALSLIELNKYQEALDCCNLVISLAEEDENNQQQQRALEIKGNCLNELKRFKEALYCFNKQPNEFVFVMGKSNALIGLKQYDKAVECLSKALKMNQLSAEAHYNISIALNQLGRKEEAQIHRNMYLKLIENSY